MPGEREWTLICYVVNTINVYRATQTNKKSGNQTPERTFPTIDNK